MVDTSNNITSDGIRTVGEFFFTVQEIEDCLERLDGLIAAVPNFLAKLVNDYEEANDPIVHEWIEFFQENPRWENISSRMSDMYINSDEAPDYETLEDFLVGLERKAKDKRYE